MKNHVKDDTSSGESDLEIEEVELEPEPLDEDMYGMGISSLIRDMLDLWGGKGPTGLHIFRALTSVLLLWFVITMQMILISDFKRLVEQRYVHRIRTIYSEYESWMYDDHTVLTVNGFNRGVVGFFNASRFYDLPAHLDREFICNIPFSQPMFLFIVLMIWNLTVMVDLRTIWCHTVAFLIETKTVNTLDEILEYDLEDNAHGATLMGLTVGFKLMLLVLLLVPRACVDIVLLYLGCRWLVATASFADIMLNCIALEFIVLLKDMIYSAVVPAQTQMETRSFLVPSGKVKPGWKSYFGSFSLFVVACAWTFLYMYMLQRVLPEYRWDIAVPCRAWIAEATDLTFSNSSDLVHFSTNGGGHRR